MVLMNSDSIDLGSLLMDFSLPDVDGSVYSAQDFLDSKGLLVSFICNHCPYVQAKISRLVDTIDDLKKVSVSSVCIMPNDTVAYPDDSLENMKIFKATHNLRCPYLLDESQEVARSFGAQCTPEFFLYMRDSGAMSLKYHGRLDSGGKSNNPDDKRELYLAALEALDSGVVSYEQHPSIGCSIKWRE